MSAAKVSSIDALRAFRELAELQGIRVLNVYVPNGQDKRAVLARPSVTVSTALPDSRCLDPTDRSSWTAIASDLPASSAKAECPSR